MARAPDSESSALGGRKAEFVPALPTCCVEWTWLNQVHCYSDRLRAAQGSPFAAPFRYFERPA